MNASTLEVKCMQMRMYTGRRTKFVQHKVASENTPKRYKKNSYSCSCCVSWIFLTEFHSNAFFYRNIDNFIQYGTLQDRRYDALDLSYTFVTEETVDEVEKYFSENPNSTVRKAAQILQISESSLHQIVRKLFEITFI